MEKELLKMSPKGQLVIPQEIREMESFKEGDRFIAVPVKEGVLFKKVKIPNIKIEFEKIAREIEAHFKEKKVTREDVVGAIKWARKR